MRVTDIVKNKRYLIKPYINKYSKLTVRYYIYKLLKKFAIEQFNIHKKVILKKFKFKDNSGFKDRIANTMVHSLITDEISGVIKFYNNDFELMKWLKKESDLFLEKRFLVLGEYLNKDDIFDEATNSYRWQYDYKSKYQYKLDHYSKVRKVNTNDGVDIKNVWELSRMQYLFAPALYWKVTKNERYAKAIVEVIRDWIVNNKYAEGPNWNISMEVGIRVTNMILAFQLIFDSEYVDDDFTLLFYTSVYEHYKFILKNEENVGGITSNHYLGGLLGLTAIVTTFPTLDRNSTTLEYVQKSVVNEMKKQILEDGADFEGSTSYHRLVGEIFSYIAIMLFNNNIKLNQNYKDKLRKMAIYSLSLLKPNNEIVQIGDNDGGRIFLLGKENNLDHRQFINLAFWITTGNYITRDYLEKNMIFTGLKEVSGRFELNNQAILYPKSKIAVIRTINLFFMMGAVDAHMYGMGGHTHNDKLSFELFYKGRNFIVDPGTAIYTGNPALRNRMRSVNSHSTATINDSEQNRFSKNGLFASKYDCRTSLSLNEHGNRILIEGRNEIIHEGKKVIHTRVVNIQKRKLLMKDWITGYIKSIKLSIMLHPDVNVKIKGSEIILQNGGESISIITDNKAEIKEAIYSCEYGVWIESLLIVLTPAFNDVEEITNELIFKLN